MKRLSVPVSAGDRSQGVDTAQVVLVEYGDFECPDAGAAYPVVKQLQEHFGERLKFVFRHFPLRKIHPAAEPAARLAEFAAAHGKFWRMHDALFENQDELSPELLLELAVEMGLERDEAKQALTRPSAKVDADLEGGRSCGVHGTPAFFIQGEPYTGKWKFEGLSSVLEGGFAGQAGRV